VRSKLRKHLVYQFCLQLCNKGWRRSVGPIMWEMKKCYLEWVSRNSSGIMNIRLLVQGHRRNFNAHTLTSAEVGGRTAMARQKLVTYSVFNTFLIFQGFININKYKNQLQKSVSTFWERGGVLRGEARVKDSSAIALETADREASPSHR
jgi:hypothetical protein